MDSTAQSCNQSRYLKSLNFSKLPSFIWVHEWCIIQTLHLINGTCNTLLKSDVTRRDHVVHCHGSQECWFTLCQFRCQFHSRRHSLRITLKSTTLVDMRSMYAWTRKSWQRSEWRLDFNSVITLLKSDVTSRDHVVRCRGSQECGSRFVNFACQFHWRWHSLRITLKSTTLLFMRSSDAWTTKPWQRN